MANNNRIIFYTDGSAARQLEPELPKKRKSRLPKMRRTRQPVVYYDPVALCSLAVTVLMFVLMVVGVAKLAIANVQENRMEQYVIQLSQENAQLQKEYESGYDLEQIREEALAMGMIPKEQAETITVQIRLPEPVPAEPSVFEQVWRFLTSLFA
jgi:hypothetical protein